MAGLLVTGLEAWFDESPGEAANSRSRFEKSFQVMRDIKGRRGRYKALMLLRDELYRIPLAGDEEEACEVLQRSCDQRSIGCLKGRVEVR